MKAKHSTRQLQLLEQDPSPSPMRFKDSMRPSESGRLTNLCCRGDSVIQSSATPWYGAAAESPQALRGYCDAAWLGWCCCQTLFLAKAQAAENQTTARRPAGNLRKDAWASTEASVLAEPSDLAGPDLQGLSRVLRMPLLAGCGRRGTRAERHAWLCTRAGGAAPQPQLCCCRCLSSCSTCWLWWRTASSSSSLWRST